VFLKDATFSFLTKALRDALNMTLNYKAGLKQVIDLSMKRLTFPLQKQKLH